MSGYSTTDFQEFIDIPISSFPEIQRSKKSGIEKPSAAIAGNADNQKRQESIYDEEGTISENRSCDLNRRTEKLEPKRDDILPEVLLFKNGTGVTIVETAENFGKLYEEKEVLFRRISADGHEPQVQTVANDRSLRMLSAALACSEFEKVARITTYKNYKTVHAVLTENDTKRILCCPNFMNRLPPLRMFAKCPVIIEAANGGTRIINTYDRRTGIFAMGERPAEVDANEAIEIILSSIDEFHFKSPADKSRALASIITPAIIMGGIANFRSPIDLSEADDSQAGKGFRTRINAAYYNETPYPINQHRGGVGGMGESFNQALIEARIFINLDNLKPVKGGVFDSEPLCSFMTEDNYYARMLRKGMFINPRLHIIQMTTNGCTLSKDLMNRTSPVAILKRNGHSYKEFPEGSILDHVRHNQSKFLGAVFSIIRPWVLEGKPKTSTTAHESSFTPWAQSLDWIVQNIMGQAPLLDGYEQVHSRITSPYLQKLRDIALAVIKAGRGEWITASDIIETVGLHGIALPGVKPGYDFEAMTMDEKENARRQLGKSFKNAFDSYGSSDVLILDGIRIARKEETKTYVDNTTRDLKYYNFSG